MPGFNPAAVKLKSRDASSSENTEDAPRKLPPGAVPMMGMNPSMFNFSLKKRNFLQFFLIFQEFS